jgi:hypothetical protein
MLKKFKSFINENNEDSLMDTTIDNTNLLEDLLMQEKEISISLNDIIFDSGVILELNSGVILEKFSNETDWKEYDDETDFNNITGAHLKDYEGNKSIELLDFINSFNIKLDIVNAYFEGSPGKLLELFLRKK